MSRSWKHGYVVIENRSFIKDFSLESRTYRTLRSSKAYDPTMLGYSIFGDCLNKRDNGIRLDMYLKEEKGQEWIVNYCYFKDIDENILNNIHEVSKKLKANEIEFSK